MFVGGFVHEVLLGLAFAVFEIFIVLGEGDRELLEKLLLLAIEVIELLEEPLGHAVFELGGLA